MHGWPSGLSPVIHALAFDFAPQDVAVKALGAIHVLHRGHVVIDLLREALRHKSFAPSH